MITDWIENHIDDHIRQTGNGEEVHFNCVCCDDTRHRMYVNLHNGKVYCHNCNYSGNIVNLIQYVEGVDYNKAADIFSEIKDNLSLPENVGLSLQGLFAPKPKTLKRAIPLPEEYSPIDPYKPSARTYRAIAYLHRRKITNEQISYYKMGFCYRGEYKDRVIIPISENNELKFWVARAITPFTKLKEKSPSNEDYQISKSEVIFNIDRAAREFNTAIICEGIFDALAFNGVGVSLLGKKLYKEQLNMLLSYKRQLTEGVYIALDWDAKDDALKMAEELSQYFDVKLVNIPKEDDDPNRYLQNHGRQAMWRLIENAETFDQLTKLRWLFK